MAEVLARIVSGVAENTPEYCNVKETRFIHLNGIPHCGSTVEPEFTPPGSVVCINADAVLCQENRILCGTVKAPVATALFKVHSLSQALSSDTSKINKTLSERKYIHVELMDELQKISGDLAVVVRPEFFRLINKNIYVDDKSFIALVRESLNITQTQLGAGAGMVQFAQAHQGAGGLDGTTTWPSVMMHGARSESLPKDSASGCEHAKLKHFRSVQGSSSTTQGSMEHVYYPDSLALETHGNLQGGTMLFQSELGVDGCVGLYVKKIKRASRWNFLQKQFKVLQHVTNYPFDESSESLNRTFSTLKYKYYIMVRCNAGQVATEFYENLVRGLSIPQQQLQLQPKVGAPSTIGEFACSSYYRLYMKQCAENARRLAYKFSKCIGVSVKLIEQGSLSSVDRLEVAQNCYTCPEVQVGYRDTDWKLRKLSKLIKRNKANRLASLIAFEPPTTERSTIEEEIAILISTLDKRVASNAQSGESEQIERKRQKFWKKYIVVADGSLGIPPMGEEKNIQFSNTLRLYVIPSKRATDVSDNGITKRSDSLKTYVQIHGETVSLKVNNTKEHPLLPEDKTAASKVLLRLPPLQGYAQVTLGHNVRNAVGSLDPRERVMCTNLNHIQECSLMSYAPGNNSTGFIRPVTDAIPMGDYFERPVVPFYLCNKGLQLRRANCVENPCFHMNGISPPSNMHLGKASAKKGSTSSSSTSTSSSSNSSSSSSSSSSSGDEKKETRFSKTTGALKHCEQYKTCLLYDVHSSSSSSASNRPYRNATTSYTLCDPSLNLTTPNGRSSRLERQALTGCFISECPTDSQKYHYLKALSRVYNNPSDLPFEMNGSGSSISTLDGRSQLWVNPKHTTGSAMVHVRTRDSIAELLHRSLGNAITITVRHPNPCGGGGGGEGSVDCRINHEDLGPRCTNNTNVSGYQNRRPASAKTYTSGSTQLDFVVKKFKPVCCVDSVPISHDNILTTSLLAQHYRQ